MHIQMDSKIELDFPIACLQNSTLHHLAILLDPIQETRTVDTMLQQDYVGLAELMGFSEMEVDEFSRTNKTKGIIQSWAAEGDDKKVRKLWDFIRQLERYDVLETQKLIDKINRDYKCHMQRVVKQSNLLTVGDVTNGAPVRYDAFISICREDVRFRDILIEELENQRKMKLFILERDLLPGVSKHSISAQIIYERCNKFIAVFSEDYINSPECDFQVKTAHTLSPGARNHFLIPLIYKKCTLPPALRFITTLVYDKTQYAEHFYKRLHASLQTRRPPIEISASTTAKLRKIELLPEPPISIEDTHEKWVASLNTQDQSRMATDSFELPTGAEYVNPRTYSDSGAVTLPDIQPAYMPSPAYREYPGGAYQDCHSRDLTTYSNESPPPYCSTNGSSEYSNTYTASSVESNSQPSNSSLKKNRKSIVRSFSKLKFIRTVRSAFSRKSQNKEADLDRQQSENSACDEPVGPFPNYLLRPKDFSFPASQDENMGPDNQRHSETFSSDHSLTTLHPDDIQLPVSGI